MANLDSLTFKAWQRSQLFDLAKQQGPRLGSQVSLTLRDINTGQSAQGATQFTLMAAADVAWIKPSAIKHMAPSPFARDAETTKLVHIDLWEYDLPWRYTPQLTENLPTPKFPNNPILRPWLVLLVGTAEEIQVEGGLVKVVKDSVLAAHNLAESHLWAHTQWDGHTTIGRILSPRGLETSNGKVGLLPQHEYVAVLVPAFNDAGQPMWSAPAVRNFGTKGVLPAFHTWRFWTAESGDFETLAAALRIPPAGAVGKAKLHYRRTVPADGVDINATLEVRGAITSLQQPETPQAELINAVKADLDLLNDEQENTIGLPHYGRPWLPNPDDFAAGWPHELNDDPRFRGTTGLGVWMGVEAQEALMDAAVAQAGALREAGQRVGYLALGLQASGRLWSRRLPTNKNERLRLLGPLTARMVAADGGIVLDRVTSGSSPLAPAIFSSAAQRLLRDRSGPTRHLANGGLNHSAALDAANQPDPSPERAPAGLPHVDAIAQRLGLPATEELLELDDRWLDEAMEKLDQVVRAFIEIYQNERDRLLQVGQQNDLPELRRRIAEPFFSELLQTLQALLAERQIPCEAREIAEQLAQELGIPLHVFCEQVLASQTAQQQLRHHLRRAIRQCMAKRRCRDIFAHRERDGLTCDDLLDTMPSQPRPRKRPIDLGRLSDALHSTLDPRKPDAPARLRWCSRLVGLDCTRLIPPEFPIGLNFPTWGLLNQYDKEWLLPGASALAKDSITALQTNPTFIDAFMVGINTQFMSEMRWRDLAVDRTCTPLRMFWGQVNYATQQRQADIQPLGEWAKAPADPVGALSHQSIQPHDPVANTNGSRLVIIFRSDLFRRYPSTLVYLVKPKPLADNVPEAEKVKALDTLLKATPELDKPDNLTETAWRSTEREFFGPIFAGTLTPELSFFTFDVTPSDLDLYWLVLDEPPAELRFRNDSKDKDGKDKPINRANAATFAESTLDQPTRVAISGKELEEQAKAAIKAQEIENQGLNP